jgi:hypothetical protein
VEEILGSRGRDGEHPCPSPASQLSTGGNGLELQVRVSESKSWRVHSMGPRMFLRTAMT